jgi:uncharacterized protein
VKRSAALVAALAATLAAAAPAQAATVLATGDSMIQIVDRQLAKRVERHDLRVRSDARIATGISKPGLLDWPRHARSQAARYAPRATVVFIGANDGFDMRTPSHRRARCCGKAWVREYARRAGKMMATYARGGSGRVYWLLLPQARSGFFRKVYPRVNAGLRLAARSEPRGVRRRVRLVELNHLFTPHGRYRASMRWHGHRHRVRQRDGIHLSVSGAAIAAAIVARKMRADSVLSGG